jgi:transaldolase
MAAHGWIKGFTTNPTHMRKAGVKDYRAFALDLLSVIRDRPISFEVFADAFDEMERQAREIASWGPNVLVKIPISNTQGKPADDLVQRLARAQVALNVTAVMTLAQVEAASDALAEGPPSVISVFAGRIADTGRDPVPHMKSALEIVQRHPGQRLLWASPRELLNLLQADDMGCHIITMTNDLLEKMTLLGKDLDAFSLETVQMFYTDARKAGYELGVAL